MDDLTRLSASLFMIGTPGLEPRQEALELIDAGVAGVILFKRNVESAAQVNALIRALKAHAGRPLLLAVDQEGGRVARLRGSPFTAIPAMRELGRTRDAELAERVGRLLGFEVRAVGFDWDFAPVMDVDTRPDNPVIADRALHSEPQEVARLGVALARGLESQGVASCAKHFPGHGDTTQDSHVHLPRLPHDLARLRAVELVPFAAYAAADLAAVMTAHVVFEALEPGVPATMSRAVLHGLLREELGFRGVIVSDDLEMSAVANHFPVERAVVDGLVAGVDLFLVCHSTAVQRRAIEAVVAAVKNGKLSESRLEASAARIAHLAQRFAQGPQDLLHTLGSEEHRRLASGLSSTVAAGLDPTETKRS